MSKIPTFYSVNIPYCETKMRESKSFGRTAETCVVLSDEIKKFLKTRAGKASHSVSSLQFSMYGYFVQSTYHSVVGVKNGVVIWVKDAHVATELKLRFG